MCVFVMVGGFSLVLDGCSVLGCFVLFIGLLVLWYWHELRVVRE